MIGKGFGNYIDFLTKNFFVFFLLLMACDGTDNLNFQAVIDEKLIKEYLESEGINDAVKTSSGLYYRIIEPGEPSKPMLSDTVEVLFVGRLLSKEIFDSTLDTNEPSKLFLENTVKGFQEGMQLIGRSGHIHLYMPSELGFGSNRSQRIPANAVLLFDIRLLDFY